MGASRTLRRKLDLDLIEQLEAVGRQPKPKASGKKKSDPRDGDSYRGARRNSDRIKGWPVATFAKSRPLAPSRLIHLNRSPKWTRARTYEQAREMSPSSEIVR